jgi:hypothetical protein
MPRWPSGPPKLGPVLQVILAADAAEMLDNVSTDIVSIREAAGSFAAFLIKLKLLIMFGSL